MHQAAHLQAPGCGVPKCRAAEDKLEPGKKVMQQLDSRKKEQQAAQDRQLDGAMASASAAAAPANKQNTLADCVRDLANMGIEGLSGPPQLFTSEFYHALQTANFSVHNFKTILSILKMLQIMNDPTLFK
eukprot:1140667-Pelagomonas_calceolata.AAC.3